MRRHRSIIFGARLSERLTRLGRHREWHQVEPHLAMVVVQRHGRDGTELAGEDVNAVPTEDGRKVPNATRTIVIARDREHWGDLAQSQDRLFEEVHRALRRNRAIVEIARDHNRIRATLLRDANNFFKRGTLNEVEQLEPAERSPEMPICGVHNSHVEMAPLSNTGTAAFAAVVLTSNECS
jgi:hypothetical protein